MDIMLISDGLCGELYTEFGWIALFSKERYYEIIYADSLWIHTKENINNLVSFFEELDSLQPSAIFPLSETEDYFQEKILLFKSTGDIVNLRDKVNESFMKEIKCIYWD